VEPLESVTARYRNVVQNLRMVKRPGQSRWQPQERHWSEAALGEDREGRALLLFCGTPLPLDRLIDGLLALPLGLVRTAPEGGSQAAVRLRDGQTVELAGRVRCRLSGTGPEPPGAAVPNASVRARDAPDAEPMGTEPGGLRWRPGPHRSSGATGSSKEGVPCPAMIGIHDQHARAGRTPSYATTRRGDRGDS
jgi:hypothetical protein